MSMRRGHELRSDQLHIANAARQPFESWLELVQGENQSAIERFLEEHGDLVETSPGSRAAHHAWEGGYKEHIRQTMLITAHLYDLFYAGGFDSAIPQEEEFTLSDALTVMFLHDIEKPFLYNPGISEQIKEMLKTKEDRKRFRTDIIKKYGFVITPTMENALKFVEGVHGDDYIPGKRADQPLAALCHAADNFSARAMYNFRG